jgi:hypothetical protein
MRLAPLRPTSFLRGRNSVASAGRQPSDAAGSEGGDRLFDMFQLSREARAFALEVFEDRGEIRHTSEF